MKRRFTLLLSFILLEVFPSYICKANQRTFILDNRKNPHAYTRHLETVIGAGIAGINQEIIKESYAQSHYSEIKFSHNTSPLYLEALLKANFSFIFTGAGINLYSQGKRSEIMGVAGIYLNSEEMFYLFLGKAKISDWKSDSINQYSPVFIGMGFEYKINPYFSLALEAIHYMRKTQSDKTRYTLPDAQQNKISVTQSALKLGVRFYPVNFHDSK